MKIIDVSAVVQGNNNSMTYVCVILARVQSNLVNLRCEP